MRQSRDTVKLIDRAAAAPWEQDFYHFLRELECANGDRARIGSAQRPQEENFRLAQAVTLRFAPATFSAIEKGSGGRPPRLLQEFFGLLGPNGPMPIHITEFARDRVMRYRDQALIRFLDVLTHRPLSLFYRAWAQAQPTVSLDRPKSDRFAAYVGALAGLGTSELQHRDAAGDHVRLFFSGWFSQQIRSSDGLRSILSGFFRLPVRIVEFSGHWLRLPAADLTRLGGTSSNNQLGMGAVLGARVWDRQHRIQIRFGPLSLARYRSLLPGGDALPRLQALMRHYLGREFDWDLCLILKGEEVPPARLGQHSQLGWTGWLGGNPSGADADDLILDVERVNARAAH